MKRFRILAATVLLFACDAITEPVCACSPPGGGEAVITGTVTDPAANPVVGVAVQVRLLTDMDCEEPASTITRTATSGRDGRFRHLESWSGGPKCFRVWAEAPEGFGFSDSQSQFIRVTTWPDSIDVTLRLR